MPPKEIRIDGVIGQGEGEVSAQMVREQLPGNGTDPIAVKIHSEGGSVFEGFAIHDLFEQYKGPKSLSIESCAFSIASFIPMAFDTVDISSNGYMMLHNPYMAAEGDDEDFAKTSQRLAQLKETMVSAYAKRSGKSEDEIRAILKDETYLNAEQSVAMGFASRIAGKPVIGRPIAKMSTMPHGVVSALFGAGSGGEQRDKKKGQKMSEPSQPVAATLQEIKAAFPKAKAEFIVRCLEQNRPMASVAQAAVEEMMNENAQLRAEIDALKAEKAKAALPATDPSEPDEDDTTPPSNACNPDEMPQKTAKASGVKPVAKAKGAGPSAREQWNTAIDAALPKCRGDRAKAVAMVNRNHPGLRAAFVAEANS